ncbi:MAG: SDR family NAD(P)-dependent oxidoreductase [Proteobacteria bacterium]|nr:SDR family NAD(P)-dependent oxidoreductase [Pseudomonadota bacterium]
MKNILITGAASGLGKAVANKYASQGWRILAVDIQDDLGQAFVDELNSSGKRAEYYHCDIGHKKNFDVLYQQISAKHKCIDVLFNNAGIASVGTLASTTEDEWDRLIRLDLMSVIYGTMAMMPLLHNSPKAHIVSTASFAGIALMPGMMSYNVTKAGVIAFSETLQGELALHNIGVSVACPAFFQTNLVNSMTDASDRTKGFISNQMQTSGVTADDVANDIYQSVENNVFMIISHQQSRRQYLLKRLFPVRTLAQKIKTFAKLMQNKQHTKQVKLNDD